MSTEDRDATFRKEVNEVIKELTAYEATDVEVAVARYEHLWTTRDNKEEDLEILRLELRDARVAAKERADEDYDPVHAESLQASVDFDAAAADQKEANNEH